MRYMEIEGHTYKVWMSVDIDIIMRVFIKNSHTKCRRKPCENYLLSFSFFGEEI